MENFDESFTLPGALKRRRTDLGQHQRDAADTVGVSLKNFGDLELVSIPKAQCFQDLCDYLDAERAQFGLQLRSSVFERDHLLSLHRHN